MNSLSPAPTPRHPAEYSAALLPHFVDMLQGAHRLLDPFAGKGQHLDSISHQLPGCKFHGVELEPEWAAVTSWVRVGDALALPWPDGYFDAICTSPCYGNRMADHHEARDRSKRNTYRHCLGRPLHPNNAGMLQWGKSYRRFHERAWKEARRVLCPGGRFVLNIKDHYRAGELQLATDWHIKTLTLLGLTLVKHRLVECPGNGYGANGRLRAPCESIVLFRLGGGQ